MSDTITPPHGESPGEPSTAARVMEAAVASRSYFVLLVLSTVIASFGLVANSAATVIGAMIVAPLMGPILGVALSLVTGNARGLRRSLVAESLGVIGCFLTALAIAWVIGPQNIDYGQSEIAGRTSPTLYDMAVGLAAGLAAAYATLRPRISGSIAGVAIAVALVPPVSVTGMAVAGASHGLIAWKVPLNSFLLFLANFVTIELAAALVFWLLSHEHHQEARPRVLTRGIIASLVLCGLVAAFLTQQLVSLISQRRLQGVVRQAVQRSLARVPQAGLSSLHLDPGSRPLTVRLVIRAAEPLPAEVVAQMHRDVEALAGPVTLSMATLTTSDYSSPGNLEAPRQDKESPEQAELRLVKGALLEVLRERPRVELISFRRMEGPVGVLRLFVSLRTPKVYDAESVSALQEQLMAPLQKAGGFQWTRVELTVRSTPIQDFTADGPVDRPMDAERSTRNLALEKDLRSISEALEAFLAPLQAHVVTLDLEAPKEPQDRELSVLVTIRSRSYLAPSTISACANQLAMAVARPVRLKVENQLATVVECRAAESEDSVKASPPPATPLPTQTGTTEE